MQIETFFTVMMCSNGASCGKVVIVGAGPAGALSAIYLAKQNYTVEVRHRIGAMQKCGLLHAYTCTGQQCQVTTVTYVRHACA